jgi:hypothetical protein
MNVRNVQSRITKLEARRTRPDEMLVVWRPPDGGVAQALKDATFARGDKVICSKWFDNRPPPKPRWYSGVAELRHGGRDANRARWALNYQPSGIAVRALVERAGAFIDQVPDGLRW